MKVASPRNEDKSSPKKQRGRGSRVNPSINHPIKRSTNQSINHEQRGREGSNESRISAKDRPVQKKRSSRASNAPMLALSLNANANITAYTTIFLSPSTHSQASKHGTETHAQSVTAQASNKLPLLYINVCLLYTSPSPRD